MKFTMTGRKKKLPFNTGLTVPIEMVRKLKKIIFLRVKQNIIIKKVCH